MPHFHITRLFFPVCVCEFGQIVTGHSEKYQYVIIPEPEVVRRLLGRVQFGITEN